MTTARRRPSRPRTQNERRAYGGVHERRRKVLLEQLALIGSAPCPACGLPMTVANRLHLDHSDPAAKQRGEPGDRLIHAVCNESIGGQIGAAITHANGTAKPPEPPQRKLQKPPMTAEEIGAAMAGLEPHHEGCRCQESLTAQGAAPSRCW
jgi:hypothetical protein